ncbi:MAG TPA: NADH:flavin oxidoreductase [Geminicoccus sp.]|uniref:NADH:flavin oxidoreductase n=1 Tax=Geminicoccus sp. TaxID=2024832 RepID=UPI002CF8DA25|nr:NADH:flavin oxidoreductase [Geminicoccus sp.]HWL68834.1 NADH:flavin oxidoreductase [Geminicoccus sp.]
MAASASTGERPDTARLFNPLKIGQLEFRNRLAVAPMTRVSATAAGHATARMSDYYGGFAEGGFGLVITEGLYTDQAFSQGYLFQPGLSDDTQCEAWKPIVERVHAGGARFVAQLMHAGALSQGNRFRDDTRGPSAIRPVGHQMALYRGSGQYPLPVEMTKAEIDEAIAGFAAAAVRAREAGFDGVEIHGANGYLLDQFLTEGVNRRADAYGGGAAARLRITLETAEAVRAAVGPDFTVGMRSSQGKVNDFVHKWRGEDEAAEIYGLLGRLAIDYLHTTEFEAWRPAFSDGPSLASLAKRHSSLPVLANGSLHDTERATEMFSEHQVDMITLGRGALTHADWPHRVAQGKPLAEFDRRILSPLADLDNVDRVRSSG